MLGVIRQATGAFTGGFVLLAVFCVLCLLVCWKTSPRAESTPAAYQTKNGPRYSLILPGAVKGEF